MKQNHEQKETRLKGTSICESIEALKNQVNNQFPGKRLSATIEDLETEAKSATNIAKKVGGSHFIGWFITLSVPLLLFVATIASTASYFNLDISSIQSYDDIDGVVNIGFVTVLIGLFVRQFITIRRRTNSMKQLHKLRTIIHILDMKQQNKKYHNCLTNKKPLSHNDNIRYLDDCSQAIVLAGKVAALMIEGHNDALVIATVSEIDSLCNGITNRIWQKIQVFQLAKDNVSNIE